MAITFAVEKMLARSQATANACFSAKDDVGGKSYPLFPKCAVFTVTAGEFPAAWETAAIAAMNAAIDPSMTGTLTGYMVTILTLSDGTPTSASGVAEFFATAPSGGKAVPVTPPSASFKVDVATVPAVWATRAVAAVKAMLGL